MPKKSTAVIFQPATPVEPVGYPISILSNILVYVAKSGAPELKFSFLVPFATKNRAPPIKQEGLTFSAVCPIGKSITLESWTNVVHAPVAKLYTLPAQEPEALLVKSADIG